jgi:acyl carrier protein
MTDDELIERVRKQFHGTFGPQVPFRPDLSRLDEPRWTSLKHVEFIIALEVAFGVRFDGADATDMTSMGTVLERVRQRLG